MNHITTLSDFVDCKNLEELYIRKNQISDLTGTHEWKLRMVSSHSYGGHLPSLGKCFLTPISWNVFILSLELHALYTVRRQYTPKWNSMIIRPRFFDSLVRFSADSKEKRGDPEIKAWSFCRVDIKSFQIKVKASKSDH